jgi:Kdo2-lipid IVA lauroyltransferase/acyltransferase
MLRKARRPLNWTRRFIIWPVEASGLWLWWTIARLLPRRVAITLAAMIGEAIGPLLRDRSRKINENLANVLPNLSPKARRLVVRRIWGNFARVLADYPHLHSFCRSSNDVIEVIGEEHLEAARQCGAFLLVGAHFGHWELPGIYASRQGIKGTAIYAPDPNPLIDAQLQRCRLGAGKDGSLIPKQNAAVRGVITALARGEAVFLLADHRVEDGKLVPFFGRPAMTTLTPARLAHRFGCPILPARAKQLRDGRYRIIYSPLLRPNVALPADEDILQTTARLMRIFESWIRATPEQWNYLKRRWPKHDSTSPRSNLVGGQSLLEEAI